MIYIYCDSMYNLSCNWLHNERGVKLKKGCLLTVVFLLPVLCSCSNESEEITAATASTPMTTAVNDNNNYSEPEQEETEIYQGQGNWQSGLFELPATMYNNDLAMIGAEMSEAAERDSDNDILHLLSGYRLYACESYNYGGSAAFVIGQDNLYIDGRETTVLIIVARGTRTPQEALGDVAKGGEQSFLGHTIWDNVYDFEEKIWEGLNSYIEQYPAIKTVTDLKILVTGHSLGGAAANAVGARITDGVGKGEWWSDKVTRDDIYVYTFGAIKVLAMENNVSAGYENIHNIYNYYDSYGPNGNQRITNASSLNAKFGHTELYYLKYEEDSITIPGVSSCNSHLMGNYMEALNNEKKSTGFIELACEKELTVNNDPEDGEINDAAATEDVELNGQGAVSDSFSIEGKWKSVGAYGFGQAQPGAIVIFDGTHCNFYSPSDTYALYQEDGGWRLDCTDFLFANTVSFTVEIIDNDNINVYYGSDATELKRVN